MTNTVNGQAVPNQNGKAGEVAQAQKPPVSHAERFTNAVIKEFSANTGGELNLSPFQKRLCQNYFIKLDLLLKEAEQKRLGKKEQYRDPTPLTWDNVNIQKLANDVVIFSGVGLDPTQPNHINPIPFKNKNTGKYDITFIPGYKGIELKGRKYGLDVPDDIVVELVFSNDKFKAIKRDKDNPVESYSFEIVDAFNRGEIVGGFYYHKYFDKPEKNRLKEFSKKDIDKRRPDNASVEFWGGEKDKWEGGQKVGKEQVEGWYDEMAYKTIYRAAWNSITIDSAKIDSNYVAMILKESEVKDLRLADEITENANKVEIGFGETQEAVVVDAPAAGSHQQETKQTQPAPQAKPPF